MPSADASPVTTPFQLPPSSVVTTRFGPRTLHGFDPGESDVGRRPSISRLLPPQKIAWGALLTLLIVTLPVGLPLLIVGLRQLRSPSWRARILLAEAAKDREDARILLESALALTPEAATVQLAMARWEDRHLHLAAAIRHYRRYLEAAPGDWRTRGCFAAACLRNGLVDEAEAGFRAVLAEPGLSADARASAAAHLAYALLCGERLREAGTVLAEAVPPGSPGLGWGEQQREYYSGVVDYLRGERESAIELMDRLCQLHPDYPELMWSALSMRSSTFHLLLPHAEALIPASSPGSPGRVERVPATPLRCANCGAPREGSSPRCGTCHSALA